MCAFEISWENKIARGRRAQKGPIHFHSSVGSPTWWFSPSSLRFVLYTDWHFSLSNESSMWWFPHSSVRSLFYSNSLSTFTFQFTFTFLISLGFSFLIVVCILSKLTHSLFAFTFQFTFAPLLGSFTWWFSHSLLRFVFYSFICLPLDPMFQLMRKKFNLGRPRPCCSSGHLQLPWWLGERGD